LGFYLLDGLAWKIGEQDSVVLGLTFEEQKEIINTNYNVPFSKSIF